MTLIYKIKDKYNAANDIIRVTPYIYNLSRSVGEGGANQKMDVLLVQNLLNIVYSYDKPLTPNGHCNHYTIEKIRDFQTKLRSRSDRGNMVKADGRLDPIHNHGTFTPSHSFIYGIFVLNAIARMTDWRKYLRVCVFIHLTNNPNLTDEFIDYYGKMNMPDYAPFCQVKDFFK